MLYTGNPMSCYFSSIQEQTRIIPEIFFSGERFIRETVSIIYENRIIAKENTPKRIAALFASYLVSPNVLVLGSSLRLISLSYPSPELTITIEFLFSLTLLGADIKLRGPLSTLSDTLYSVSQPGFVEAALRGDEKARVLISTLEGPKTHLSQEETWIKRAFNGDYLFSKEEFHKLNKHLKSKIYFVANAFGHRRLVKLLKSLGMAEDPVFSSRPHILAHNMDIITADTAIKSWLKQLRKKGLLFTEAEFNDQQSYFSKRNDITRIYGRDFVQRFISDHDLKHIKVPKKIAVIKGNPESLTFKIHPWTADLRADEDQIEVYAEYIKSVKRKLSLEEAIEFALILEKTGYSDFYGSNFLFAEDGIYFIDTESKDFEPEEPKFSAIESIKNLINPEDVEMFMQTFVKRKEAFVSKKTILEKSRETYNSFFQKPYKDLVSGYKDLKFIFETASLLA